MPGEQQKSAKVISRMAEKKMPHIGEGRCFPNTGRQGMPNVYWIMAERSRADIIARREGRLTHPPDKVTSRL